jgi:hypothetical protein
MRASIRRLAQYNTLLVEKKGNYAVVTLNRPKGTALCTFLRSSEFQQ